MNYITPKQWLEIFPEATQYLEEDLKYQLKKFDRQSKEMKMQMNMIDKLNLTQEWKDFHAQVRYYFIENDIRQTEKRIKKIDRYLRKDIPTNGITDEDIERAKEYPFESLIKFNNSGFAKCPFHTEKTPSFHLNKNKNTAHCFGACSKTWDTIAFLMELENISFVKAVHNLI